MPNQAKISSIGGGVEHCCDWWLAVNIETMITAENVYQKISEKVADSCLGGRWGNVLLKDTRSHALLPGRNMQAGFSSYLAEMTEKARVLR
ncbi:hypothetical protein UPYG_G00299920 [Umbra pygmaea]|uniref:Uncharacterized protein n=1 Tax=Umbra pygmaea TaxID=75934 RepID=A0ABD0WAW7_UMBPY